MSEFDDLIADIAKAADKRIELCKKTPICDKCETDQQMQLVAWINTVEWECRFCGLRMYGENNELP